MKHYSDYINYITTHKLKTMQTATIPQQDDKTAIRHLLAEVLNAFNTGEFEKAIDLHTEDVVLMETNMPAVQGKQALRDIFTHYFALRKEQQTQSQLDFEIIELEIMGDRAYARGSVRMTTTKKNSIPLTVTGKFLCLFKRQPGGSWLRSHIVSNTDTPAGFN
ncbi:MAG: DUF4440 domain-containing protein [Williamsia sp.]|nr:DUF4440 domain-containing protein [Williamsia sp.]